MIFYQLLEDWEILVDFIFHFNMKEDIENYCKFSVIWDTLKNYNFHGLRAVHVLGIYWQSRVIVVNTFEIDTSDR